MYFLGETVSREEYRYRLKYIWLPLPVCILICSGLYALWTIWAGDILRDTVAVIYVPFGIGCLASLLLSCVSVRKLELIRGKDGKEVRWCSRERIYTAYIILAVALPVSLAGEYVYAISGPVEHLASLSDISQHPMAKYYFIDKPCLDIRQMHDFSNLIRDGKSLRRITLVAAPACPPQTPVRLVWVGQSYDRGSQAENEETLEKYRRADLDDAAQKLRSDVTYYELWRNSDVTQKLLGPLFGRDEPPSNVVLLMAHHTPYVDRNGNHGIWLIISLLGFPLLWLLMVLKPELKSPIRS